MQHFQIGVTYTKIHRDISSLIQAHVSLGIAALTGFFGGRIVLFVNYGFFFVLFLAEKLTRCQQHLHQLTGHSSLPPSGAFVPKCRSDDGHYKSLQCDSSSSVCFCVDNYDGYVLVGSTGVRQGDCSKFGTTTFVLLCF